MKRNSRYTFCWVHSTASPTKVQAPHVSFRKQPRGGFMFPLHNSIPYAVFLLDLTETEREVSA